MAIACRCFVQIDNLFHAETVMIVYNFIWASEWKRYILFKAAQWRSESSINREKTVSAWWITSDWPSTYNYNLSFYDGLPGPSWPHSSYRLVLTFVVMMWPPSCAVKPLIEWNFSLYNELLLRRLFYYTAKNRSKINKQQHQQQHPVIIYN